MSRIRMLVLAVFVALTVVPVASAEEEWGTADVGLFSFQRVSAGVTAVHEWVQPEGDGALIPNEWFTGATFAYNLLYPTAEKPGTWPTSLTLSVLYGLESQTTPVRAGISVILLRGGK